MALLDHPGEEREGAVVDAGLPAETLVVLDEGASGDDLAIVAAVNHLVGVRQRDVGRRDAMFGEEAELLERPDPFGAMGQDQDAGGGMGDRGGLEGSSLAIGDASLPATLMTPAWCSVRSMVAPR